MRRRLAEEKRLREEAQRALAARDALLAQAAHELRTPMTAVIGGLQLTRRLASNGGTDVRDIDRRLESTESAAWRLNHLVNGVLDVSRLQTGRLALDRAEVDLCEMVHEAAADMGLQEGHEGIRISDPPERVVYADRTRLYQIVVNLLENAVRYGGQGPIEVTINGGDGETPDSNHGDSVTVRDHGPGVREIDLARIFEEGERGDTASLTVRSGMGLGLFISRQLAELHGGTLTVRNCEGGGAEFRLWLPRTG